MALKYGVDPGANTMTNGLSPLAVVLAIVFSVSVLGALSALVYNLRKFSGFRGLGGEAQKIHEQLGGELFRDGGDLVTSGNFGQFPTVVRFSNKENVPGLNIRVGVPANFTLWIAPRSSDPGEGRALLRTGDSAFDARFITRSDDATQARLFLALQQVAPCLRQLACSAATFVAISQGWLEISELEIPRESLARHVQEHLESIGKLAEALKHMPGADQVKVEPLRKERRLVGRAAIAVGAVAAVLVVAAAHRSRARKSVAGEPASVQAPVGGVLPVDASRIAGVDGWRVATGDDFDADAAAWLRTTGIEPVGRITGDFSGSGKDDDVAYLLVRDDGARRIVLLINGEVRYDVRYPSLAVAARIPQSALDEIEWAGAAPAAVDGDGLLVVRAASDPQSGLVFFVSHNRIVTGVPANYQSLRPE